MSDQFYQRTRFVSKRLQFVGRSDISSTENPFKSLGESFKLLRVFNLDTKIAEPNECLSSVF